MLKSKTKSKKYTCILAIQIFEFTLAALLLMLSYLLAGKLIYTTPFPFGELNGILVFTMISAVALILVASKKYFNFMETSLSRTLGKAVYNIFTTNLLLIVLLYFAGISELSPYYFVTAGSLQIMFLLTIKILSFRLKIDILKNKITLIIGKNGEKNILLRALQRQGEVRLTFVSEEDENLKEYVSLSDNIYLLSSSKIKLKEEVIAMCELMNKRLFIVPHSHEIAMRNSEMSQIGDIPLFAFEGFKLSEAQFMVKRLMDLVLSLSALIVAAPVLLIAGIFIKKEDGGPVFYTQLRTGLNGKEYKVIKLRSMVPDAEKCTGAVLASENDPRVTKVGHFIRATRIDEIPQFFNVFCGSMSIVGPRPERPVFVSTYTKEFPEYLHRMAVKPGITGLAQVMANYTTTTENKLKFDLIYIKEYSPMLDLKILLKTVQVMIKTEQSKGFSPDLVEEIEAEDLYSHKKRGMFHKTFKIKKVFMIMLCCIIVITGSILLRYSMLAVNVLEALTQPVRSETEELSQEYSRNDEISELLGTMSLEEKVVISYELFTNINARDLIALEKLAKDGVTRDERAAVEKIMPQTFKSDDLNQLTEIITGDQVNR